MRAPLSRLSLTVMTLAAWLTAPTPPKRAAPGHRGQRSDSGQATTEYALVLLGAALVALLLIAWATAGGGAGKIGRLFDRVLDAITSKF